MDDAPDRLEACIKNTPLDSTTLHVASPTVSDSFAPYKTLKLYATLRERPHRSAHAVQGLLVHVAA
ncbi:MAG: hypothetical protein DRP64_18615 [Verrucomicrobia bacterium]|nr:MAG: hypothetical protein DRP64_18615 [Verrucomicrobiota bacterium]